MSTLKYLWRTLFPPMPREILVMRHAESKVNVLLKDGRLHFRTEEERQMYGSHPDHEIPLSEDGERHAKAAGIALLQQGFIPDVVITTGYERTEQTAFLVTEPFPNLKTMLWDEFTEFRERKGGYTEHMLEEEVKRHFPWKQADWDRNGPYLSTPVGGESLIQKREGRTREGIRKLKKYAGKRVLLVGHGRTNMCIHMEFTNMNLLESDEFCRDCRNNQANCSVSLYQYDAHSNKMRSQYYGKIL